MPGHFLIYGPVNIFFPKEIFNEHNIELLLVLLINGPLEDLC